MSAKSVKKEKVIRLDFIPDKGSEIEVIDGKKYLIANDGMYTFYKRTKGEFSEFFIALRDDKKLLGNKCTKCGIVRVPPFCTHCSDCNFTPTKTVEVGQVGVMNSTPPITYFANSLFLHMAPFGRGRVIFEGADTAISINLYTTTGILVPGIFKKGTKVKLVFRTNRIGEMVDVFGVPASELNAKQLAKKGLLETEINWNRPAEPKMTKVTKEEIATFKAAQKEMKAIIGAMNKNARARKDILGWKRNIQVKGRGGQFVIAINNGSISLKEGAAKKTDFTLVSEDPKVLLDGLAYRGAITDSIINKKLWISKNMEFSTVFKLDRMARSVARSKKS